MIYILIVTTIEPLRGENHKDYSENHLQKYFDIDYISYVFLSLENAEREIKAIISNLQDQSCSRQVFNVKIKEYDEGVSVSDSVANHLWLYNRRGILVEEFDNVNGDLISREHIYSAGDVVEMICDDVTVGLGIIVRPLDDSVYLIVDGPEYDDTTNCHSSNLRPYEGPSEIVKFMRTFLEIYKKRYGRQ